MKSLSLYLLISALGLLSLNSCHRFGHRGNGHMVTEERQVAPFTKISVNGVFPVEISQTGDKESVKVKTDENLQKLITVRNDGDELIIENSKDSSISSSSKVQIYINIKSLRRLDFNSVGNLTSVDNLKLDSLYLSTESVGKLDLDITADFLHADLNSVGSNEFKGKVREVRINNKSVGALSAFDLKAGTLMIHNTAIGIAEVYADSAFYVRSDAIGALYYKGPGVIKEMKSEGIGKVEKRD
jgi:hypothetical protein